MENLLEELQHNCTPMVTTALLGIVKFVIEPVVHRYRERIELLIKII